MSEIETIQGSPEWHAAKCGRVGASRIGDVMRRTKTGWSADRKRYLGKIVAERITGKPAAQRAVMSLEKRLDMEPEARIAYEFYSGNDVVQVGCFDHPTIPNAVASPDGLVGEDGGLELKCCDTDTHIEMLLTGVIDDDYIKQCLFGMACTGRKWWDFGSYDPTMPEELKLLVKRIERDDAKIAEIESAVIEFNAEADAKVAQVLALIDGKPPLTLALEKSLAAMEASNVL